LVLYNLFCLGLDTVPRNLPGLAMNFRQRVQHQGSLTTPLPGPVRQGSLSNQGGGGSRIRPTRQASQWSQSPHFSMSLAVPGHGAHTPSRRYTLYIIDIFFQIFLYPFLSSLPFFIISFPLFLSSSFPFSFLHPFLFFFLYHFLFFFLSPFLSYFPSFILSSSPSFTLSSSSSFNLSSFPSFILSFPFLLPFSFSLVLLVFLPFPSFFYSFSFVFPSLLIFNDASINIYYLDPPGLDPMRMMYL